MRASGLQENRMASTALPRLSWYSEGPLGDPKAGGSSDGSVATRGAVSGGSDAASGAESVTPATRSGAKRSCMTDTEGQVWICPDRRPRALQLKP
eukprot:2903696-Prymnesium_polylepis.2